ncbi:MAG: c-type cytochrome [Bacteroidota bacterium]|jgi:cytochrome c|nr:c-type cytochrome [Algoriphagus sp.]
MKTTLRIKLVVLALAGFTFACGGGDKSAEGSQGGSTSSNTPSAEVSLEEKYKDDPIYIKGLEKVKASDCTGCHQVDRKIIGPSYADVAAKYDNTEANVSMLAQKVIAGGVGVWGQVPMSAHPGLSEEDAKDMIRYILLLKK